MYLVILWGIVGCVIEGPFADEDTAKSWLNDYEPDGADGLSDQGSVIGPIPSTYTREFE